MQFGAFSGHSINHIDWSYAVCLFPIVRKTQHLVGPGWTSRAKIPVGRRIPLKLFGMHADSSADAYYRDLACSYLAPDGLNRDVEMFGSLNNCEQLIRRAHRSASRSVRNLSIADLLISLRAPMRRLLISPRSISS